MVTTKVWSIFRLPNVFIRIVEWNYNQQKGIGDSSLFWSVNARKASQD